MKSHAEPSIFLATAQYLLAIGLCPVLLSGKQPILPNWQKYISGVAGSDELALPLEKRPYRYSPGLIEEWARVDPGANVGILTRDRPTVDIDSPHIWDAIKDLLPPTPHCKRGARGFSLIYSQDRLDPVRKTRTFADPFSKQMLVEFLGDGRQTVLPPSIHPDTGEAYVWLPVPWWGYMQAVPLSSAVPPALSQAVVDAIDRRLQELGLIKRRVPKGVGLAYTAPPADRYRYEAFFKVKLAEKLAAVRDAQSGTCRDTLNGAVFALAPWVREGFITEEALEDEMRGLCEHNGWIGRDGDKAFKRQYDKALDDGWHKELPVLAERYEVTAAPTGFTMLPASIGPGLAAPGFSAARFPDEVTIKPRPFINGTANFMRGYVSATVSAPKVGKTALLMAECMAMAAGIGIFASAAPTRPQRVAFIGEDPVDELERRYVALMKHYRWTREMFGNRWFVESFRDKPFKLVNQQGQVDPAAVQWLKDAIRACRLDVLTIDPVRKIHDAEETNTPMEALFNVLNQIAEECQIAIQVIVHTRKPAQGAAVTVNDIRGASSQIGAARHLRALSRMTSAQATQFNITEKDAKRYVCEVDGEGNMMRASENTLWWELKSVMLENACPASEADNKAADNIQVMDRWFAPEAASASELTDAQELAVMLDLDAHGPIYRTSQKAGNWVGDLIGRHTSIDMDDKLGGKRVKALIARWLAKDYIRIDQIKDKNRVPRPTVVFLGYPGIDVPEALHQCTSGD